MDALNLREVTKIFSSLIVSPIVGLVIAGGLIFLLRRFWSGTTYRRPGHCGWSDFPAAPFLEREEKA